MKQLQDLDLNLLKLLRVVVETKNTHTAAEQLGISQTSVSRGLSKLRETFGEQLFIRKAHGVEPSPLAEKLAEASQEMLTPLLKVVDSYHNFTPTSFDGEVTIAMQIYFLDSYGEGILEALTKVLPNAKFKLIHWQDDSLVELLSGNIDYVVQFEAYPLPQEIFTHHLNTIQLNLVAREQHPILSQSSDWEAIHQIPLARLVIDGHKSKRAPIEDLYLSKGYQANVVLATHNVKVLLSQVKRSDTMIFWSGNMQDLDQGLASYPLPKLPKEMQQVQIIGAYLQTKRGFPLNQLLHQTMQSYFDQRY